jgi:uncharacterized glyoxalase superfamily protein PhnB
MALTKPAVPGVVPTIQSPDCDKHIAWIKNVFNAEQAETYRSKDEKTVLHCSLIINGGYVYLYDISSSMEAKAMKQQENDDGKDEKELESRGIVLHLELEDPAVSWGKALTNGGTVIEELKKQYWGGHYGSIRDPFGFVWGFMKGEDCRKRGVIPYFMLPEGECSQYVEWMVKALGGEVKDKYESDDKKLIQHCTVEVNGGFIYMADDIKMAAQRAETTGSSPNVICHLDMSKPKSTWEKLLENDVKVAVELEVQFWGDLYGSVRDSTGYMWSLSEAQPPKPLGSKMDGVVSYIVSPDCEKHIKWIKAVFGGEVKETKYTEAKKIMHCVMSVNGGTLMLSDRLLECGRPPADNEPKDQRGFILHLNVSDPDAIWKRAMGNGGVSVMELKQQFWGEYYGMLQDPFGYQWSVLKA